MNEQLALHEHASTIMDIDAELRKLRNELIASTDSKDKWNSLQNDVNKLQRERASFEQQLATLSAEVIYCESQLEGVALVDQIQSTKFHTWDKNLTKIENIVSMESENVQRLATAEIELMQETLEKAKARACPSGSASQMGDALSSNVPNSARGPSARGQLEEEDVLLAATKVTPTNVLHASPVRTSVSSQLVANAPSVSMFTQLERRIKSAVSDLSGLQSTFAALSAPKVANLHSLEIAARQTQKLIDEEMATLKTEEVRLQEVQSKVATLRQELDVRQGLADKVQVQSTLDKWFDARAQRELSLQEREELVGELHRVETLEAGVTEALRQRWEHLVSAQAELQAAHVGRVKSLRATTSKIDQVRTQNAVTAHANVQLVRNLKEDREVVTGVIYNAVRENNALRSKLESQGLPLGEARRNTKESKGVAVGTSNVDSPEYVHAYKPHKVSTGVF